MPLIPPDIPPGQDCRGETPGTNRRRHDAAPRLVQVWHTYTWHKVAFIPSYVVYCPRHTEECRCHRLCHFVSRCHTATCSEGKQHACNRVYGPAVGPAQPSVQRGNWTAFFPGMKVPEREAYHSPPYSAEVKMSGSVDVFHGLSAQTVRTAVYLRGLEL